MCIRNDCDVKLSSLNILKNVEEKTQCKCQMGLQQILVYVA